VSLCVQGTMHKRTEVNECVQMSSHGMIGAS
jgi:hypothetical protein